MASCTLGLGSPSAAGSRPGALSPSSRSACWKPSRSPRGRDRSSSERGRRQRAMPRAQGAEGGRAAAGASALEWTAEEAGPQPPEDDGRPIFYTHTLCPYAERVWLALLEKGVPFRLVHVDLSRKPAWYRRVNPRGLVPAVQHAGEVHFESADVCAWVDEAFAGPALAPADPAARRRMQELLRGPCSGAVSAGLDLCAGRGRHWGIGGGQSAAQKAALDEQLRQLAAALQQSGGPFLLGPQPSLADIVVAPFVRRFAVAAPLIGFDARAAGGGAVGAWLDALGARPSGAAAAPDPALLLAAFRQHKSLDFFDYDSYAAFQLHPRNAARLQP